MGQLNVYGGGSDDDFDEESPSPAGQGGQVQVNPLDSILDEIDTVLEVNAESFVQGFVQKGGQ